MLAPLAAGYWMITGGSWIDAATVALMTAGLSGYAFTRGVHNGSRQLIRLVIWDLFVSATGLAVTAVMLSYGHTGVTALSPVALSYLVITVAGWPRGRPPRDQLRRELDHFVAWSTVGTLASTGLIHLTMLVAEQRLPSDTAGLMAAALNLVTPAALLANSFSMAFFPQIASALASGKDFEAVEMAKRATKVLTFAMGGTFGLLVIGGPWIVEILWGHRFAPAAAIFPVLAIGPLVRAVSTPAVAIISSRGRSGIRSAGITPTVSLLLALCIWFGVPSVTWVTIAIGYSAAMTLTALRLVVQAASRFNLPWLGSWLRLTAGACLVGTVSWLRDANDWPLWTAALVAVVALGAWAVCNSDGVRYLARRPKGLDIGP